MKIEDELQQTAPFRCCHHRAIVNMIYTNNWLVEKIKHVLKPYKITMQQYNVLRILRGAGEPISTCIIRDRMVDKMSDASRMVSRLEQKGLVVRKSCSIDKRLLDVSLSGEGQALLKQIEADSEKIDRIFCKLTNEEAQLLSKLLDKVRE